MRSPLSLTFFFFNDTATTEIYTLSLHDALPIYAGELLRPSPGAFRDRGRPPPRTRTPRVRAHARRRAPARGRRAARDRKSTRLNSSHSQISYAVFCLKKKKATNTCESYAQ